MRRREREPRAARRDVETHVLLMHSVIAIHSKPFARSGSVPWRAYKLATDDRSALHRRMHSTRDRLAQRHRECRHAEPVALRAAQRRHDNHGGRDGPCSRKASLHV